MCIALGGDVVVVWMRSPAGLSTGGVGRGRSRADVRDAGFLETVAPSRRQARRQACTDSSRVGVGSAVGHGVADRSNAPCGSGGLMAGPW